MSEFGNQTVVITGAANPIGIGRAIAEAFAREGANLSLLDIDTDGLTATADTCRALGARVVAVTCNVGDGTAITDALAASRRDLGPADVVVSNAGIARRRPFLDLTEAQLDEVMSVNFGCAFRLIRGALPDLIERDGSALCTSSIAGSHPGVGGSMPTTAPPRPQ